MTTPPANCRGVSPEDSCRDFHTPRDATSGQSRNTAYEKLIHQRASSWAADKEKILFGPFDYLYGHPGKDVRAQLIAAFNAWLQVPTESLAIITKVVGMLHTASLLYVWRWACVGDSQS